MKKLCHCQPMWAYSYNYPTWYGLIVSPMDWRSRIEIILNLNLNLEVDGLVSSALSAHVGPMFVQPALECIDRWRHHNVLRKPVPVCDYSVAERIFPDIATTSGNFKFQTVTSLLAVNADACQRLRSTTSLSLIVRRTRLSTVSDRTISGCCR